MEKRGMFVDFEGIDGSGKTTQIAMLADAIRKVNKYQDVLLTREPTWRAEEIKSRLKNDMDSFSGGDVLTKLFVEDRRMHTRKVIVPNLEENVVVLTDRYSLSTCAYQSAQGVDLFDLIEGHEKAGIIKPNMTFFIDISGEEAGKRKISRGEVIDKFEKQKDFVEKLIAQYKLMKELSERDARVRNIIGEIYIIDGHSTKEEVSDSIVKIALPFYKSRMGL